MDPTQLHAPVVPRPVVLWRSLFSAVVHLGAEVTVPAEQWTQAPPDVRAALYAQPVDGGRVALTRRAHAPAG
jgi:hypothetical protein